MSEVPLPLDEDFARRVGTSQWAPAPDAYWQPLTVVTATAKELLAALLADVPLYGALHTGQPDPSDPYGTLVSRQWVYWERVPLLRDGSVLWNSADVVFTGVVDSAEELWLALGLDSMGGDVLFAGELVEFDRELAADGVSRTVVLAEASVRIAIA